MQKLRNISWLLFLMSLLLSLLLPQPVPARAQQLAPSSVIRLIQNDLDDDGDPDQAIIQSGFATGNDLVIVYDGGDSMPPSSDWQIATDFIDDTWLFDAGADGTAQLIIRFSHDSANSVAELYHDLDGDSQVSYSNSEGRIVVSESSFPPLVVEAQGDWLRPDGGLNWNLLMKADGHSVPLINGLQVQVLKFLDLPLDGTHDTEAEYRDTNADGIPDYGLWRFVGPSPDDGFYRFFQWVNTGQHQSVFPADRLFWTLLGSQWAGPNYFDTTPLISMDWKTGKIQFASLPGYPTEHGYHVNSLHYLEKGVTNFIDFEIAQNYYDLAGDQDGLPELHIRHRYFDQTDKYALGLQTPVNEIRWSWNQANKADLVWDYKISLAGRHLVTEQVAFDDFSYLNVPYEDLPGWALNRSWDLATFVAWDSPLSPPRNSEGIASWGAIETAYQKDGFALTSYLNGERDLDLQQVFVDPGTGYRGEVAIHLNDKPALYISSIDGKLHLTNANFGVWKYGKSSEVRYADLDHDGYFDSWQYYRNQTVLISELIYLSGYLIYSDLTGVYIKQVSLHPAELLTKPPITQAEYKSLGENLAQACAQPGRDCTSISGPDLKAIFDQMTGETWGIAKAVLENIRPLQESFRFVIKLEPGYRAQGSVPFSLDKLTSGRYLVVFADNFEIRSLTLPQLQIRIEAPEIVYTSSPFSYQVEYQNTGLEDISDIELIVEAVNQGQSQEIARQKLNVHSDETGKKLFGWHSTKTGELLLTARLENKQTGLLATTEFVLLVESYTTDGFPMMSHSLTGFIPLLTMLILFVGLLVSGASIGWQAFWKSEK